MHIFLQQTDIFLFNIDVINIAYLKKKKEIYMYNIKLSKLS